MTSSWEWSVAFNVFQLCPFGSLTVEDIEIVEGYSLVVNASMPTEDVDLVRVVGGSAVCSGLRCPNLALCIFRLVA